MNFCKFMSSVYQKVSAKNASRLGCVPTRSDSSAPVLVDGFASQTKKLQKFWQTLKLLSWQLQIAYRPRRICASRSLTSSSCIHGDAFTGPHLWCCIELHRVAWSSIELHGVAWSHIEPHGSRQTTWNSIELYRMPHYAGSSLKFIIYELRRA